MDNIISISNKEKTYCHFRAEVAQSFFSRMLGLLTRPGLEADQALVITKCNSIHTFFMRFDIDVVFLDDENNVIRLEKQVKSAKYISPVKSAKCVIEFSSGVIDKQNITVGDKVHFTY